MSFSDENTAVNHTGAVTISQVAAQETDGWRRPRSESSGDAESMYMTTNTVLSDSGYAHGPQSRRSSVSILSTFLPSTHSLATPLQKSFSD